MTDHTIWEIPSTLKDIDNEFNIQIDVFSIDYVGQIHCHETWGILHVFRDFFC